MTRILILWLLSEGPLHGYRIQKILSAPAFAFWFRIEDAAIYSMLRTLVKRGFACIDGEERIGRRPQRTVFRITRQGREELHLRIQAAWRRPERDQDPVSAALATVDELEEDEIQALMRDRKTALENRAKILRGLRASAPSARLAGREAALLEAELAWIDGELQHQGQDQA